ncbi:toll/interleukin-1 receptor domain-containing protein [Actinokineospora sp. 24-640]
MLPSLLFVVDHELTDARTLSRSLSVAALNHADNELIIKQWDVFISHASEDKDEIVRPLAHALQDLKLRVWCDEFELKLGDSLRRKIDQGIANSAFGVVVLSESFFAKGWAQYELDGLVTRTVDGSQVMLPL